MTTARDAILARLERARPPAFAAPDAMTPPPTSTDPIGHLRDRVEESGGRFQSAARNDWRNQVEWPIDLSTADHIFSASPNLESRGVGQAPGSLHDLHRLDLCLLRVEFAVVENGAAWHVPSEPRERAAALLATHLVLLVDSADLVDTLHQAYDRIDFGKATFGWFLCGPSKTADIEQSLVLGAHGACTMSLVVLND